METGRHIIYITGGTFEIEDTITLENNMYFTAVTIHFPGKDLTLLKQLFQQENNLRSTRLLMEQQALSLQQQINNLEYEEGVNRRNYERAKKLLDENLISQEEFENTRDQFQFTDKRLTITRMSLQKDSLFRNQKVFHLKEQ